MRAIVTTVGPLIAASANSVALSQSISGAGAVTINGSYATAGVATLDKARRVIITSAGNDSAITFIVSGTSASGNPISEVVTGANAGVATGLLDYKTVTSITTSASTAAAITVGTNSVAGSVLVRMDEWSGAQSAIQAVVSGTVNYTVQQTQDDPNDPTNPVALSSVTWFNSADATVVAATASAMSNFAYTPRFVRVVINSGTGSVTFTCFQHGTKHVSVDRAY